MKSFALHLVVVFIIGGALQQPQQTFCSSLPASTTASSTLSSSQQSSSSPTSTSSAAASFPQHSIVPTSLFARRFIPIQTDDGGSDSVPGSTSSGTIPQQQYPNGAKTPRTIQRLIAGHIEHRPNYTNLLSKAYFRRKPDTLTNVRLPPIKSTILKPIELTTGRQTTDGDDSDYREDAALLDDTNEIGDWDEGILRLSAGAGKESTAKSKKKDDSKKTLSDQVRDGKYGLIENVLFKNAPKRPGIISYLPNKEVPDDNAKNYGGLRDEDIWLAEDHLLVLKGGSLNTDDTDEPWIPIDDYQAPNRQIKIPANPKVPPPFPVQFEDNGPVQIIGNNKFPFFYPKNASDPLSLFPENGYAPPEANRNDEKNLIAGSRSPQNATSNKDGFLYPPAYPPWLFNNESFKNPFLNFAPPPPSPLPFDNGNDYIDEDDPSLYYPPAYSFVYKSNYTNPVEPGPLVPGIVLPPPPNAFARLEDTKQRKPPKTIPFSDVLNKIREEIPKVRKPTTTTTTTTTEFTTTSTQPTPSKPKEIYYVRQRPRPNTPPTTSLAPLPPPTTSTTPLPPQPEVVSFVPQIQVQTPVDSLSIGKPIYYEYFDARNVPPTTSTKLTPQLATQQPIPTRTVPANQGYQTSSLPAAQQIPTLSKPYTPQKLFPTPIFRETTPLARRPAQQPQQQKPLRINPVNVSPKPYSYEEYLFITPKPEIFPNGLSSNLIPQPQPRQPFKIQSNFEQEVDAIRQTLQYYKAQNQYRQNFFARNPKAKTFYEYAFGSSSPTTENLIPHRAFTPPTRYDDEPFKPMVSYSRPVDDENGFKAIAYPRTDNLGTTPQNVYYTTTAQPEPLNIEIRVGDSSRPTSLASSQIQQPVDYSARDQRTFIAKSNQQGSLYLPPQSSLAPKQPWVSIEKQVVQEIAPENTPAAYRTQNPDINRSVSGLPRNGRRGQQLGPRFQGYYYSQPPPQRPNHRFQQFLEQPFQQQVGNIRAELSRYQLQRNEQQPVSLENDTYVNSLPGRTLNPDAEYINLPPRRPELFQQQRVQPPATQLSPGSNIYRKPIDLEHDILVNYNLPLPPINPDSEYIQPQFVNRNPQQHQQHPQQQFYQRPQYSNNNNGGSSHVGPIPTNSRPPNIYYVNPQRDYRFKGA